MTEKHVSFFETAQIAHYSNLSKQRVYIIFTTSWNKVLCPLAKMMSKRLKIKIKVIIIIKLKKIYELQNTFYYYIPCQKIVSKYFWLSPLGEMNQFNVANFMKSKIVIHTEDL